MCEADINCSRKKPEIKKVLIEKTSGSKKTYDLNPIPVGPINYFL
jgi:hypothetical protein